MCKLTSAVQYTGTIVLLLHISLNYNRNVCLLCKLVSYKYMGTLDSCTELPKSGTGCGHDLGHVTTATYWLYYTGSRLLNPAPCTLLKQWHYNVRLLGNINESFFFFVIFITMIIIHVILVTFIGLCNMCPFSARDFKKFLVFKLTIYSRI